MKQFTKFLGLGLAALLLLSPFALTLPVSALPEEKATEKSTKPAYSQLLTPVKQDMELNPGEVFNGHFDIYNHGTKTFTFRVYTTGYQVSDKDYKEVKYDTNSSYSAIQNWVSFEKNLYTVEPDGYQRVFYTITVPQDIPAGGQYATIMSEITDDPNDGSTIKAINRVGMVIYAKVNGETKGEGYGEILENSINTFFLNPPISVSSLVKNNGNVHGKVKNIMTVYPLFSNEAVWTNNETPVENYVLPETERFTTVSWEGSPRLGIFRVVQTVEFMGKTSKVEKLVIICPLWLIALILLIIISFIIRAFVERKKRHLDN